MTDLARQITDLQGVFALGDPELSAEAENAARQLEPAYARALRMAYGPEDRKSAYLAISAGAGGREAWSWARMLWRMYEGWFERLGLDAEVRDVVSPEVGFDGIKSVVLRVEGAFAYGKLKRETGVHRLSRVSPFDKADRRQTSFASVEVIPEAPPECELVLDPRDLEIQTCCGGGPGGQKINKTEVVAVVRHLPTGIIVRSQAGRSQSDNKQAAIEILRSRLLQLRAEEKEREAERTRQAAPRAAFGNAYRRTYVLSQHPAVHDHRTRRRTTRVREVLDGELDELVG